MTTADCEGHCTSLGVFLFGKRLPLINTCRRKTELWQRVKGTKIIGPWQSTNSFLDLINQPLPSLFTTSYAQSLRIFSRIFNCLHLPNLRKISPHISDSSVTWACSSHLNSSVYVSQHFNCFPLFLCFSFSLCLFDGFLLLFPMSLLTAWSNYFRPILNLLEWLRIQKHCLRLNQTSDQNHCTPLKWELWAPSSDMLTCTWISPVSASVTDTRWTLSNFFKPPAILTTSRRWHVSHAVQWNYTNAERPLKNTNNI